MTAHLVEAAIAILGLVAQPFFAALLWDSPQWGLQVVAIVYALGWVWEFRVNWLRPARVS